MKKCISVLLLLLSISLVGRAQSDSYNFQRALEAAQHGDSETAFRFLGQELNEHPNNGHAFWLISLISSNEENNHNAMRFAQLALDNLPKKAKSQRAQMYAVLGDLYLEARDSAQALHYYEQSVATDATFSSSVYLEGLDILLDKGDIKKATQWARTAYANLKEPVYGAYSLAKVYRKQKNYDSALQQYNMAVFHSLNTNARIQAHMLAQKADLLMEMHQFDQSITAALQSINLAPGVKAVEVVNSLADSVDYQIVLDSLAYYEKNGKRQSAWHLIMADICEAKHLDKETYLHLVKAQKIDESAYVYRKMSSIAIDRFNDAALADENIKKAFKVDSADVFNYIVKADLLHDLGHNDEALDYLTLAITKDPSQIAPYVLAARTCGDLHRHEQAVQYFYDALVADPEWRNYYFSIATEWKQAGDTAKMNEVLRIGEAAYAAAGDTLGAAELLALGRLDEACERALSDSQKDPDENTVRYNSACILAQAGRLDEAMSELRVSMELGMRNFYHFAWDTDLDNLRQREDYQQMMHEFSEETEKERKQLLEAIK